MRRKVQRKPIRYLRETAVKEQLTAKSLNIQETAALLGGLTGLIVAILWLAGRFYAAGYYGAMNIPAFQINFSIWEYAEVAWSRLIFYFLRKIYPPLTIIASIAIISLAIIYLLQRMLPKLKLVAVLNGIASQAENVPRSLKSLLIFVLVMYFISTLLDVFIEINVSGRDEGQVTVLKRSYAVEVYSKDGIPLGVDQTIPNSSSTLNHYDGLRLLTYNNGRYYLFRDIDPTTCKPLEVFVITDTQDVYFVFGGIAPVTTSCELATTE